MTLFQDAEINLQLPDANIIYIPDFLSIIDANRYFKILDRSVKWQQDDITIFGKTYKQPRLTALYGEKGKLYSYSNITMHPHLFTSELQDIKLKIETTIKHQFNACLLNLYRDGNDSNGWHSDDEKELGKHPVIASVSFGAERVFQLKHKTKTQLKHKLVLKHGSLLVMKGSTQELWKHQIPKTRKKVNKRINLTYRYIK